MANRAWRLWLFVSLGLGWSQRREFVALCRNIRIAPSFLWEWITTRCSKAIYERIVLHYGASARSKILQWKGISVQFLITTAEELVLKTVRDRRCRTGKQRAQEPWRQIKLQMKRLEALQICHRKSKKALTFTMREQLSQFMENMHESHRQAELDINNYDPNSLNFAIANRDVRELWCRSCWLGKEAIGDYHLANDALSVIPHLTMRDAKENEASWGVAGKVRWTNLQSRWGLKPRSQVKSLHENTDAIPDLDLEARLCNDIIHQYGLAEDHWSWFRFARAFMKSWRWCDEHIPTNVGFNQRVPFDSGYRIFMAGVRSKDGRPMQSRQSCFRFQKTRQLEQGWRVIPCVPWWWRVDGEGYGFFFMNTCTSTSSTTPMICGMRCPCLDWAARTLMKEKFDFNTKLTWIGKTSKNTVRGLEQWNHRWREVANATALWDLSKGEEPWVHLRSLGFHRQSVESFMAGYCRIWIISISNVRRFWYVHAQVLGRCSWFMPSTDSRFAVKGSKTIHGKPWLWRQRTGFYRVMERLGFPIASEMTMTDNYDNPYLIQPALSLDIPNNSPTGLPDKKLRDLLWIMRLRSRLIENWRYDQKGNIRYIDLDTHKYQDEAPGLSGKVLQEMLDRHKIQIPATKLLNEIDRTGFDDPAYRSYLERIEPYSENPRTLRIDGRSPFLEGYWWVLLKLLGILSPKPPLLKEGILTPNVFKTLTTFMNRDEPSYWRRTF